MVGWCLGLDGRRDRNECAKPIFGCGTGSAVDPVAVFSLVRFQKTEMRTALQGKSMMKKCGKADITPMCQMSK